MMKRIGCLISIVFTTIICKSQSFVSPLQIDTSAIVEINGIQHFITIKGKTTNNPLMLFLHGGPGRSLIPFAENFTNKLQEKFVVVQWDQRETGQTLQLNSSKEKVTVDLMKDDALKMVNYLLKKFNRKKLYLVSHSWGSVMGFDIADKHDELLYAYIPISPLIDANKGSRLTVNFLKKWAIKIKNDTAIKELATIKIPYETEDDLFYTQKWLFVHNEVEGAKSSEFKTIYYQWMVTWFPVWTEAAKNSIAQTIHTIKCPIYFFEGSGDNQTFHTVVNDYYKSIKAKNKKLIWFRKSGHTIYNTEPDKIQQVLIEEVLSQTFQ